MLSACSGQLGLSTMEGPWNMEYKVVIKSKKLIIEHTNCPVKNNLATYIAHTIIKHQMVSFYVGQITRQRSWKILLSEVLYHILRLCWVIWKPWKLCLARPHLSRWATSFEGAEDAAGDEGEAEEGEHDDGADAQLRDRLLRLLLPPPQPSLGVLLLPVVDCH